MNDLRYPIGKFQKPENIDQDQITAWIEILEAFPTKLAKEVNELSDDKLDTPYRPEGWTIRQVVHHCADSHMNAYVRFKLALTEDSPTIKPYEEGQWAELEDGRNLTVESSIQILTGLHHRWVTMLKSLNSDQLKRTFTHPENNKQFSLDATVGMYAWHSQHHLAHITTLKNRKAWD